MSIAAARRWWALAAGILLGVAVGVLVSVLGSSSRRAEASVLISSSAGPQAVRPMLPNLRELAMGGVVAGNVRSTLRLTESTEKLRSHLHATVRPQSEVIAISATDSHADHARQVAQEAAVVFAQLVGARFGTDKPELHAAVLDSAHAQGGPERHLLRNGAIGALAGLLLGAATMFVLASRDPQTVIVESDDTEMTRRESLVDQRVQVVTARERRLAEHMGKLAVREKELEKGLAKLAAAERKVKADADEVAASRKKLADRKAQLAVDERELATRPAAPAPEPDSPTIAPAPALPVPHGTWNLVDLQRAVDAHASSSPAQAEEWRMYLFFLREHASQDGSLPRSFDLLIADVFADVLDRPSNPE
jgi:hypothetical protein